MLVAACVCMCLCLSVCVCLSVCMCLPVCVCGCQADFTALMFCAYHGHPMVAAALIEAGCDVNASASVCWWWFTLFTAWQTSPWQRFATFAVLFTFSRCLCTKSVSLPSICHYDSVWRLSSKCLPGNLWCYILCTYDEVLCSDVSVCYKLHYWPAPSAAYSLGDWCIVWLLSNLFKSLLLLLLFLLQFFVRFLRNSAHTFYVPIWTKLCNRFSKLLL